MPGTKAGAAKAMATIREKYPDHHKKAGRKGGLAKTDKLKGFAARPDLASAAGAKGRGKHRAQ